MITIRKKNAELEKDKEYLDKVNNEQTEVILKLNEQIEKMKKSCLDVMRVQGNNLTDDYMAGMYNGMVVIYNSCFLKSDEFEKDYCSKNEHNKWESAE